MNYHGLVSWRQDGRLLHCLMEGPFNEEAIAGLERDLNRFSITDDGNAWAVTCDVRGNSIFTPEAEQTFSELLIRLKVRGCRVVVYALSQMPWPNVFRQQIERIYHLSGIPSRFVDNLDEATRFAEETLFSTAF